MSDQSKHLFKDCVQCGQKFHIRCKECTHCYTKVEHKPKPPPIVVKKIEPVVEEKTKKRLIRFPSEYSEYEILRITGTPAGPSPFKLNEDASQEDLENWCRKVRLNYLPHRQFLNNNGLLYFLKKQYEWNSDEYKKLKEMMQQIQDAEIIEAS